MEQTLHLPPEIWLMILDYLSPSFFQQDLSRLTLCKRWYDLVFPGFLRHLEYTPKVISRLVNRNSAAVNRVRGLLQRTSRSLTVVLDGRPANKCFDTPYNLLRFGDMLRESKELKFVRFVSRPANERWKADPYSETDLPLGSISPFVERLTHLTDLDLDLCGGPRIPTILSNHLCLNIRPLLSRLRNLSIRTRCLCKFAFIGVTPGNVSLQRLTVNLYMGTISTVNPKLNSTMLCPSTLSMSSSWEWRNPMDDLQPAIKALAKGMKHPGRARIVHKALNGEIHFWDAATNECVVSEVVRGKPFPAFLEAESGRCFSEEEWDDPEL